MCGQGVRRQKELGVRKQKELGVSLITTSCSFASSVTVRIERNKAIILGGWGHNLSN
jgi:hypothetical protein